MVKAMFLENCAVVHKPHHLNEATDEVWAKIMKPSFIFLSPYLTWGNNEEGKTFVSGHGNFGNLLCYENVEKSIIEADFMSAGHMLNTNKSVNDTLSKNMAHFALAPTWMNMTRLMAGTVTGSFKHKDF